MTIARAVRSRASSVRVGAWALLSIVAACSPADDDAATGAARERCSRDSLRVALDSIAARPMAGGRLSVSVVDPATGEQFSRNGTAPVFMSSVVKLPLAVQLLARVDAGELRLADSVSVSAEQMSIGRSPLVERYPNGGFAMRVDSLLRYALSESDNTANDALLRYSGGPRRATAELQRLGIADIRIDRDYLGYARDLFGGSDMSAGTLTRSVIDSLRAAALAGDDAAHDSLSAAFAAQPEDRASTDALARLLARLARGELLSDSSRALLLRYMTQTNNPARRIVAGLPEGASAAHKSGTWTDWNDAFTSISDVGLITLPDGRRIALAVMIAQATAEEAALETVIADATRAVVREWRRCY